MNAYLPQDPLIIWRLVGVLAATLLAGLTITRIRQLVAARIAAWGLTFVSTLLVERMTCEEPAGVRMVALVVALLWGMKTVVSAEYQTGGNPPLPVLRWLGFTTLWFGMRPGLFAEREPGPLPGAWPLIARGVLQFLAGAALLVAVQWGWREFPSALASETRRWLFSIPALAGLSLMLHFGVFPVAAGLWRLAGVDARALFRAPLMSQSLGEFWARRWNLGFPEMTALAVYRPLSRWLGKGPATMASFLFSGLLHEMAISVPVGAGYGLPTLYFALHGGLALFERGLAQSGRPIERLGMWSRAWTAACLVLPLPLLFHPWFVRGTVWPLLVP